MVYVHFFEKNDLILTQLLNNTPSIDENIKIKGRKGKIQGIKEIKENVFHVEVVLERVIKKSSLLTDKKKKRR